MMTEPRTGPLPQGFEAFQTHIEWALPTQTERKTHHFRETTYERLRVFYEFGHQKADSGKSHVEEGLAYLDGFPLNAMPDEAQRLMWILLSFAEITVTIEAWGRLDPNHISPWERFPPLLDTETI